MMLLEIKVSKDKNTFKSICDEYKIEYSRGCGYYKLGLKKENISKTKKIILVDRNNKCYVDEHVRDILQLSKDAKSIKINKKDIPQEYDVFINSTSANRKLEDGATCLIEISDNLLLPEWNNMILCKKGDDIKVNNSLLDSCHNIHRILKKLGGEISNKAVNVNFNIKELDELYKLGSFYFNGLASCGSDFLGEDGYYNELLFGDEALKTEWRNEHPSPNCAEDNWMCFCSFMEYNFFLVQTCKDSPYYGSVRLVVNNCFEDEAICDGPFSNFFILMEGYAKECERLYEKFMKGDVDDDFFDDNGKVDVDLFEEWLEEQCHFMQYITDNAPNKKQKIKE